MANEPLAIIARRYGLSRRIVAWHAKNHLARNVRAALQTKSPPKTHHIEPPQAPPPATHHIEPAQEQLPARYIDAGVSILSRLRDLNSEARDILAEARAAGQRRDAIAAVRALSNLLELEARLLGELDERPQQTVQIAIVQTPEWARIREAIATALEPYPEARMALSSVLESLRG